MCVCVCVCVCIRLKLRTVVSLIPEKPTRDLAEFCKYERIRSIHFAVEKYAGSINMSAQMMANVLQVIVCVCVCVLSLSLSLSLFL